MSNIEIFKLTAIKTPTYKLIELMPTELQVASVDSNRIRSHYIQLLTTLWQHYSKAIFNATCPVFGTFTDQEQGYIPSKDV